MNEYFRRAKPVFYSGKKAEPNTQVGFYCKLCVTDPEAMITMHLTARSFCRVYVNGKIVYHGPARTAHGYARVDMLDFAPHLRKGENHIAAEVSSYGDAFGGYSNDCTLEDGLFIAEIFEDGHSIAATGFDFSCVLLSERDARSERIAHCRSMIEVYHLDETYMAWREGNADFTEPEILDTAVTYLPHKAPLADLCSLPIERVVSFGACRIDGNKHPAKLFVEQFSADFYASLSERPLTDCRRTVEEAGDMNARLLGNGAVKLLGSCDKYITYDKGESEVGFLGLTVECEKAGILDLVHSELLEPDGSMGHGLNNVARLYVPAGKTVFTFFEPSLMRYLTIYCRGTGNTVLREVHLLRDTIPDETLGTFRCSDDDVNRLYEAARRTLRLNTLDIFMDCPDRERGGWLCDSLWTSRAAALMLGNLDVEREFIENFLLTPADGMYRGFFPEVYPANKSNYKESTGITSWSFWLMAEFCEYIHRAGDMEFAKTHKARIDAFVNGSSSFIGESGLLENLPCLFIDWSLANDGVFNAPISTAANALYAYVLDALGNLYGEQTWIDRAAAMRGLLRGVLTEGMEESETQAMPDALVYDNGVLHKKGYCSEAAQYTILWSNLFEKGEHPSLDASVRDMMGPAPKFEPNPNIGRAGLFIGLCIRLDMLARRGDDTKLFEDMKAIFYPQLREGPGTLWENSVLSTSSRCHGFTSHMAGVHLTRDILGLGIPDSLTKTIAIAPHPQGLRWARGTLTVPEGGAMSLSWHLEDDDFTLTGILPAGYHATLTLPREILALGEDHIHIELK